MAVKCDGACQNSVLACQLVGYDDYSVVDVPSWSYLKDEVKAAMTRLRSCMESGSIAEMVLRTSTESSIMKLA